MTTDLATPPRSLPDPPRGVRSPKRRRKPFRRFLIVTHRWLSLVLGLVLLTLTTSGAVLVFRPELTRAIHHDAYAATPGHREVSFEEAVAAVHRAHPSFKPSSVVLEHGVMKVTDYTTAWTVDPVTGKVLGKVTSPGWLAFLDNVHECALTCEDDPGYVAFLVKPVPHTAWLGFDDTKVTYGGLALGVLGLLLLFLSLSGLWLWWPRMARVKESVSVRWKRGRFARDTDLHRVVGMIALPLLLVWGLTGAGFELGPVRAAYTAVTPGSYAEAPELTSTRGTGKDIGLDAAAASAERLSGRPVVSVDLPTAGDKKAPYATYVDSGLDPYAHGDYPGDIGIGVDRHTGRAGYTFGGPGVATSQTVWDAWSYPVHAGIFANGWWRTIWFVLGLTPLLLAVTGISTWLVRRRAGQSRRAARRLARRTRGAPA